MPCAGRGFAFENLRLRTSIIPLSAPLVYNSSMTREQAIAEIAASAVALRARGVEAAYLFGSTARGEARPDSDLDVFVDIAPDAKFSLLDLAGVHRLLNESIGRKVDVTTRESLHPKLRGEIERDAVRVF